MQLALYRFYNDGGQLLYVGITNDPPRRLSKHAATKTWWPHVRGITIDWYPTREAVAAAEKRAITVENPLHNVQHKPSIRTPLEYIEGMSASDRDVYESLIADIRDVWKAGRDAWETFSTAIQKAVIRGYSRSEIRQAMLDANGPHEPDISTYLPSYPGHLFACDIDEVAQAMEYLAKFTEPEVARFRAVAAGEEEMQRAHWHEITIRAAEIANETLEDDGRDIEALRAFLRELPHGERALDQAHRLFNEHQGAFPVDRDSPEVLELAVSTVMGVDKPQTTATLTSYF